MTHTTPPVRERYDPERDETVVEERRSPLAWILGVLAVIALAIVLFFALGGDADVDSEPGDIDVDAPSFDADVDAPDIDVDPGSVDIDPGSVDIDPADAEADAG